MVFWTVLFWLCLGLTLYPYFVFPLLVRGWAAVFGRKWHKAPATPSISLIISVYNEAAVIREKLANALALVYPQEKLEIVVVSDGSTDDTNAIVSAYTEENIVLKAYERAGKTQCLNRAVSEVHGEIIVFTDANSMFPPQALADIAANFSDERIGLVTGWTTYRQAGSMVEEAPGFYARLEKMTKAAESLIDSCVGADGAIFAIRRALYRPLADYDINDFVIPLQVLRQGQRVVLDPAVYCLEEPAEGLKREFKRQARITNRTLGAISRNREFLDPRRYGAFAFFLLSHKVLRLMVPFFAGTSVLLVLVLARHSFLYAVLFAGMLVVAGAATGNILGLLHSRLANICGTFVVTNLAQLVGWLRFATGRTDTLWTPQR